MKKHIYYFIIIITLLFLNSCIFNIKPPKPILTYPGEEIINNLPLSFDIRWELKGSDLKDITYEIYYGKSENSLNNKLITQNTYITIKNLEPETTYYLRIRSVKGNAYTDSEIYLFKTTDVPKIILENTNINTNKKTITLSWDASDNDGIKKYLLYLSTDPSFSDVNTPIYDGENPYFTVNDLQYGNTYYIKIVAYDKLNVSSEKIITINISDLQFYDISPANNSTDIRVDSIKLSWKYAFDSNDYTLIFSPNSDLSDDDKYYIQANVTENEYSLNNLPSGITFYWKIIDNNAKFESQIYKFTTSYKPEIEITYPIKNTETENYAVGVPINPVITWNATDNDNDELTFNIKFKKVSKNEEIGHIDFSSNLLLNEMTTNTFYSFSEDKLLEKEKYYALKIIADDGKGNVVESVPIKFRTNLNPAIPKNLSPNNEIDVPTNIATLTWNGYDPDNDLSYIVYFGDSLNTLSLKGTTTNTYYTLHNLEYGKNYYWQIEAKDSNNATSISNIATFTTNNKPVFKSISPSSNSTNLNLKPVLIWDFEDNNLNKYYLYFSNDSEPLSLFATLTDNSYSFINLLSPNNKYKWKVIAYDSLGATSTSGINYFSTTTRPEIKALISPITMNESLKPVFSWDATDADNDNLSYILYFELPNGKIENYTLNSTSFEYNKYLSPDKTYSWSVYVKDSNLATNISATETFKTSEEPTVTLISPISKDSLEATVTLKWNASDPEGDNLYYIIYLNDSEIGTTTNTKATITNLFANQEYTWKIMAIDSHFATNISNEATFITSNAPSGNPDIISIFDYYDPSKEYSLNEEKYPNIITIYWKQCQNVSYYNIYKEKNGVETPIATHLTDTNTTINIPEGGVYNIYVKAFNNKGFWTKGNTINMKINQPPFLQDYSPRDGEINISLHPKIIFHADDYDSPNFSAYIYFGENIDSFDYEYIANAQNISEYNFKKPLKPGTNYFWKIILEDEMKGVTKSDLRSFSTTHQPEITNVNLSNDSTNASLTLNLIWNGYDKDGDDLTYNIVLTKNGIEKRNINTSNTTYILNNLESNSHYILTLYVYDDKGASNSKIISFYTTNSPIIYNNSLRADNNTHAKNGDKIYWSASDPDNDLLTYDIYMGTDINSLSFVITTSNSYYTLSNLEEGKTYYWKIIAHDSKGGSAESEIKSFTTNSPPIFEDSGFYPANNVSGIEKNVTLKWNASDNNNDSLKFDIYFGKSVASLTPLATDYIYNNYNVSSLESGKIYYWKIVAKDGYNGISTSNIMSFTTNAKPEAPTISYTPYNGLEGIISWSSIDPEGQNITYDLLESIDDTIYSTKLYNTNNTEYYRDRLNPDTTYYWKVRAIDEKNDSSESTIIFTTPSIDTNIFTIEKGTDSEENTIVDLIELTTNDFAFIQKDDSVYYLSKIDNTGTETTINSSQTINITPYFIDSNSNILLIGINSGKIAFIPYDNNLNPSPQINTNVSADSITDYLKLSNNSYIILGKNSGNDFIAKIDTSTGSTELNTLSLQGTVLNHIIDIDDEDGNSKYIVCGNSNKKGYIAKLNTKFDIEDKKIIENFDNILKIHKTNDGFFVLGFKGNDLIIKKYNYRLNEIWTPVYENDFKNNFVDIVETNTGFSIALNNNNNDIEIINLDNNLNVESKSIFGRNGEDIANGIIKTSDNGFVLFGKTKSFNDKINGNAYIIKTDSNFIGWNTPE